MARLSLTYCLWAVGGIFGLHHIYLGRLSQAFFYAITLGFCGLGWLLDLWLIPAYVRQCNYDSMFISSLRVRTQSRPSFSVLRVMMLWVGPYMLSHILLSLVGPFEPIESFIGVSSIHELPIWWVLLSSLVQAIGVYLGIMLVGNFDGFYTVSRGYLAMSIAIGTIADIYLCTVANVAMLLICRVTFPTIFYLRSCEWLPTCADPRRRPRHSLFQFIRRLCMVYGLASLTAVLMFLSVYFHCFVYLPPQGGIVYSDMNYHVNLSLPAAISSWGRLISIPIEAESSSAPRQLTFPHIHTVSPQLTTTIEDEEPSAGTEGDADAPILSTATTTAPCSSQTIYSYATFVRELKEFYMQSKSIAELSIPRSLRMQTILRNIVHPFTHTEIIANPPSPSSPGDAAEAMPLVSYARSVLGPDTWSYIVNHPTIHPFLDLLRLVGKYFSNICRFIRKFGWRAFVLSLDYPGKAYTSSLLELPAYPQQPQLVTLKASQAIHQVLSTVDGDAHLLPFHQQIYLFDILAGYTHTFSHHTDSQP